MSGSSTSSPLRAATIGSGKISEEHLKFLRGHRGATLAGVCDLSPALARWTAKQFGAGEAFTDYREMLARARPDVVHVLTPPHTHVAIISDCLAAGAHVITEKPVAPTHAEFSALWQLAADRGRTLIEDHNYRFNSPVQRMERRLRDGTLGDARDVEVRMSLNVRGEGNRYADRNLPHPSHQLPAGVIHEFLTHLCYLALRLLPRDAEAQVAKAVWGNLGGAGDADDPFTYDDLDALLTAGPGHARLRFTSATQPDGFYVTVRGTKGFAEADLFVPYFREVVYGKRFGPLASMAGLWSAGRSMKRDARRAFWAKVMQRNSYQGLRVFLDRTYAALRGEGELPVTFDDMDRASRLIDQLVSHQSDG